MKYALALLLLLAGCAEGGSMASTGSCALVKRTDLHVDFEDGVPVVPVTINGIPGHMVLDTGAGITTFSEQARQKFALPNDQSTRTTIVGIGNTSGHMNSLIETMQIGDVTLHNMSKVAVDLRFGKDITADGYLGSDILADYDVDLDLGHRHVTLYAGRNCPQVRPDWTATADTLPPSTLHRAIAATAVSVDVDGHPGNAIIDSGASAVVIDRSFAASLGATEAILNADPHGQTLGLGTRTAAAVLHRFSTLKVGSQTYARPQLLVTELPTTNLVHYVQLLLGEPYLRTHRVWISYRGYQVYTAAATKP